MTYISHFRVHRLGKRNRKLKFSQLALLPQFEKLSHLKTTQVFNSPILMPSILSRKPSSSCGHQLFFLHRNIWWSQVWGLVPKCGLPVWQGCRVGWYLKPPFNQIQLQDVNIIWKTVTIFSHNSGIWNVCIHYNTWYLNLFVF